MARVYLSFLGTTNYHPCTYTFEAGNVPGVRFVQEATIKTFCADWTVQDRILIFTTQEAKKSNWLDDGHRNKNGEIICLEGLQSRLGKLLLAPQATAVDIPAGKSQEEIWEIFQIMIDQLQEREEVVFDVTHGFRSIPLLALVVLSYARAMKNITIQGIYYGAFEAAQDGVAPIFDLTEFDALLEWTTALDRFLKAGDASLACELAENEVRKRKQKIKKADPVLKTFNNVTKCLGNFSLSLATCRGLTLSDTAGQLKKSLLASVGLKGVRPYIPLLQKVQRELENFPGDHVRDGLAAAQWCADHNLIQQGFTILQETLISFFTVEVLHDDLDKLKSRIVVNQALKIFLDDLPQEKWAELAQQNADKVNKILTTVRNYKEMAKVLKKLGDDRNDINHAGYRNNAIKAEKFAPRLRDYITIFQDFLGKWAISAKTE